MTARTLSLAASLSSRSRAASCSATWSADSSKSIPAVCGSLTQASTRRGALTRDSVRCPPVDLTDTPQQDAFRAEVRQWLRDNLPWTYGSGLPPRFDELADEVAFLRQWQAKLAGGGWVGVAWPVE